MVIRSASPQRRYVVRLSLSMAVYVISLFAAEYVFVNQLAEGPLMWLLAVLPGLAVVGAFYAIGMLILEQKDEFLRLLLVRQLLVATGFALSVATVWGFLESFDLVPHVDAYWIAILWFLGQGLGGLFNKLTVGTIGQC